jgi:hypothetical protein
MNSLLRRFGLKSTRSGKEVISMNTVAKETRFSRLHDLLWFACDWALRKAPGAILWIIARHIIHSMTGLSLTF